MSTIEISVEQLRQDIEYAFAIIAKTYRVKGEQHGLIIAGALDQETAADYDATIARMEKECELAIDAVQRQLNGEEF